MQISEIYTQSNFEKKEWTEAHAMESFFLGDSHLFNSLVVIDIQGFSFCGLVIIEPIFISMD